MKVHNVVVAAQIPVKPRCGDLDAAVDLLMQNGLQVSFRGYGIVVGFNNGVRVVLKGGVLWGTGSPHREEVETAIRRVAAALGTQPKSLRVANLTAVHVLQGRAREVIFSRGLQGIEVLLPGSKLRTAKPPFALVWKPGVGNVTMQIFSSGKVLIVGASSLDEVREGVSRLENALLF